MFHFTDRVSVAVKVSSAGLLIGISRKFYPWSMLEVSDLKLFDMQEEGARNTP